MRLPLPRHERVIALEEDVFVVIGDVARAQTVRSAWAAAGSYGPIPRDGAIGTLEELLDRLGPELWSAKRRGGEACLIEPLSSYSISTVLLWAADCVEYLARRLHLLDGNVAETLALARRYAREHEFPSEAARRLSTEADAMLARLGGSGWGSLNSAVLSRGLTAGLDYLSWLAGLFVRPLETRFESEQSADASVRFMQVAVVHASKELCRADPLMAAREATSWCRRAAARKALAGRAGYRARQADESSLINLWFNPFAAGTLGRSIPGHLKSLRDGADPETQWQAARLKEYLERAGEEPLGTLTPL